MKSLPATIWQETISKLEEDRLNGGAALRFAETSLEILAEQLKFKKEPFQADIDAIHDLYVDEDYDDEDVRSALLQFFEAIRLVIIAKEHASFAGSGAPTGRVFIVHGHDHILKDRIVNWVRSQRLEPIVIADQPGSSRTVIELIEMYGRVDHAICLFTPDDEGAKNGDASKPRARQNVVFETGYFFALLGRTNVSVIADLSMELPSDIAGLRPIILGPDTDVVQRLHEDLSHSGMLPPPTRSKPE